MRDYEIEKLYSEVETLRDKVINNVEALNYYNYIRELNQNDKMYGWLFVNNDLLCDTLDDLDIYNISYKKDILKIYINELNNILLKVTL